jgi:hypothetical protein
MAEYSANGSSVPMDNMPYRGTNNAYTSGPLAGASKLWLPVWSGEVIHAYDQYNVFEGLVESRTISSGLAAEFPITGTVNIKGTWNAGEELVGGADAASNTIAIKLDKRPMAAHFELDNVDLMITQWEYRSELARQAGLALANARDKQVGAYIARAGVEDITWNDSSNAQDLGNDPRGVSCGPVFLNKKFANLGLSTASANDRTDAALAALQAIENFFVYLQEINAPTDGVIMVVTPRAFQDIRALGIARDYTGFNNGSGRPFFGNVAEMGNLGAQLSMGMNMYTDSLEYMGARIVKSSHIPNTNYTNIGESRYNLEFGDAGIKAMIFQKSCIGTLSLMGLKVDTIEDVRRNTTFTVASMMKGTGVLRPECSALLVGPVTGQNIGASFALDSGALFNSGDSNNPFSDVDGAHEGGAEAAKARNELRALLGANFTREFVGTSSSGFPYA